MISVTLLLSPMAINRGVYDDAVLQSLREFANIIGVITPADGWMRHRELLARTEVILTSWGAPVMDEAFLSEAPRLRAVFYAAGTVRYFITDAVWRRKVRVFTARSINAIPTSEYASAVILLSLKRFWSYARLTREQRTHPKELTQLGIYRRTVGLVSYGAVGRLVRQRLQLSGLNVIVHDPYVSADEVRDDDIRLVSLDELFSESDVISLHTPLLAETKNLITGAHFNRMRPNAVFINTARGAVVNEAEMIAAVQIRPDLQLILDVTTTEPPPADSLLYALPNIILTPHIAGSNGYECARLGETMVEELRRFTEGGPLQYELLSSSADWLA